jgi:hypothetical protein
MEAATPDEMARSSLRYERERRQISYITIDMLATIYPKPE